MKPVCSAPTVVAELRRQGQLWEAGPGLVGMRGELLRLHRRLETALAALAGESAREEWSVPAALSFETLARAAYFASFPHWLTAASHLTPEPAVLERVAGARDPAAAARAALAPADAALPPAVCYHVFAALAGATLRGTRRVTVQATCWRHEGAGLSPLERGWAFTMREVVCLGPAGEVEAFLERGLHRALELAERLGLEAMVVPATDPFFAPTARGKALLQRVKGLKHELTVALDGGGTLALASGNHHEALFGERFAIHDPAGTPAASGCVAYGLERWTLAFLLAHGTRPARWPDVEPLAPERT